MFDALLKQHHGRIFNTAGDAILAEFPSAVEAVRCATEIQSALQTRNEHLPPEQKMLFRMGINVGDVVVQEGDLLGDGVNVAARIQTIAEPGGICISGSVYDQIQNKLSLQFKPLGDQRFKNIGQPIRTFTITHGESGALPAVQRRPTSLVRASAIGAIVAAALAAGGYWLYRDNEAKRLEQGTLTAQLEAEKRAAEEARRAAAEQSRRAAEAESKAERERLAAESAKREAALQAQAQSTEETRRRNKAERKGLDEERQRLETQKQAAAAAPMAEAQAADDTNRKGKAARRRFAEQRQRDDAQTSAVSTPATGAGATAIASSKAQTAASSTFDGNYRGIICNAPKDPSRKVCWQVPLKVENGAADGTWTMRLVGKSARVHATIAREGTVSATLDGWKVGDGTPMSGAMNGRLAESHIDVVGRWANGGHVEGHWTRSP